MLFGRFKAGVSSASPKVFMALQKFKGSKIINSTKRGYDIVKDELSGNTSKRRHMQNASSSPSIGEQSMRTDIVIVPTKQSKRGKKWEAIKAKDAIRTVNYAWAMQQMDVEELWGRCSLLDMNVKKNAATLCPGSHLVSYWN